MKIIYHHRTRGEDAQGIHIQSLQDAWSELGHEVHEVSLGRVQSGKAQTSNGHHKHSEGRGTLGSLIYEGLSLGYNVYGMRNLQKAIKEYQPALIYERYCLNLTAGVLAATKHNIPFVLEVNSPLVDEMSKESGLIGRNVAQRCERMVLNKATRVVVVTDVLRKHYEQQGFDTSKFQVIHNGIDPHLFHADVDARPVRDRYNLGRRCVIGFVGWARQWHRLDLLIEAYAQLPNRERFAVLICGDGPAIPGLHELAKNLGVADAVHFSGGLDHHEIPAHIAAMDIAVLPSIPVYASPMKLFEYMAMGKAVLVPDQPNLHEVIIAGQNGMFIPKDDPNGFARAVTDLATNPALQQTISQGALKTIQNGKYFWTENARRVLQGVGLG
ncbi:MAG TPA: glycosyltransferase family 4 protein [Blastocatellia bacterium]|nr:glycosyltransferase family 4 protein [Blastocatellia bacterium]